MKSFNSVGFALASLISFGVEAQASHAGIEEVVVSAERLERDAGKVGGSITVLNEGEIEASRTLSIADLTALTPNLDVKYTFGNQNPVLTLRGVGLNDFNANNNPPVGVYTDEGYLPSPYLLGLQLFDIKRIEVLRGPQGGVHGRNTNAGAISIFSNVPAPASEMAVTVSQSNYDGYGASGFVNGQVATDLLARLAVSAERRESGPYQSADGHRSGDINRASMRLSFSNQGAEESRDSWLLQMFGGFDRSDGTRYTHQGTGNSTSDDFCEPVKAGRHDPSQCFGPDFVNPPGYSDSDGDRFTGDWSQKHRVDNRYAGARFKWVQAIGDLSFVSVTAFDVFDRSNEEDADASPARTLDVSYQNDFQLLSQEFRLSGEHQRGDWSTGLYLSRDVIDAQPNLLIVSDDLFSTRLDVSWRQDTRSAAVFGQGRWRLSEAVSAVAGVRATKETRAFRSATTDLNPFGNSLFLDPGTSSQVILAAIDDEISDSHLTGKLALEWSPIESSVLYASVANGYKSGGFTGSFAFADEELAPFDREALIALEAGIKYRSGDLRVDFAVFEYDYQDLQLFTTKDNNGTPVFTLTNAADAGIKGIELEVSWLFATDQVLQATAGLLDTNIEKFRGTPDLSGNQLPNAPRRTLGISWQGEKALPMDLQATWWIAGEYRSKVFNEVQNLEILSEAGYTLWQARATVSRGPVTLAAWVRNAGDKHYFQEGFDQGTLFVNLLIPGEPRAWGFDLTWVY